MAEKNILPQQQNALRKVTQVVTCEETNTPRQDGCWSWVVCFAAVISNILICGFTYSYGILFPALLDEFQQGKANTGNRYSFTLARGGGTDGTIQLLFSPLPSAPSTPPPPTLQGE